MYLSGSDFSASVVHAELLQRSKAPATSTNLVNSGVVSQGTVQQSNQLTPATPRTQSGVNFFSAIKLLGARVSENFMALIYTGRLRSTLVENFKIALKEKPGENDSLEEKNLWWDKVYLARNDLLDIGCNLEVIMIDLKNCSSTNEATSISNNYKHFSENLNSCVKEISGRLMSDALAKYYLSSIKGHVMAAHSCLKQMERLFLHMEEDKVVVRTTILNQHGSLKSNNYLNTELGKHGFVSDEKGRKKIDSMLALASYKVAKAAAPFKNRQVFLPNVQGMLSSLTKLNPQSSQEDFKCAAKYLIKIVSLVRHESEFDVVREMVSSSLAKLTTGERKAIKASCTLKGEIMAQIDNNSIRNEFNEGQKSRKNFNVEKAREDIEKMLTVFWV